MIYASCLQTSPAVLDLVNRSGNSGFFQFFKNLFERTLFCFWVFQPSRQYITPIRSQLLSCHRPFVLFLPCFFASWKHHHLWYTVRSRLFSNVCFFSYVICFLFLPWICVKCVKCYLNKGLLNYCPALYWVVIMFHPPHLPSHTAPGWRTGAHESMWQVQLHWSARCQQQTTQNRMSAYTLWHPLPCGKISLSFSVSDLITYIYGNSSVEGIHWTQKSAKQI